MARVAIVGEGVVGISTALAVQRRLPNVQVAIFHDRDFEKSCSFGPSGLFRIDNLNWEQNRKYGKLTYDWFANLNKRLPGTTTGVKLLSGHIQSDNEETLKMQEKAYGDIVYNFRWLTPKEISHQFEEPSKYCIHYTTFASEGNRYVPFLKSLLQGVQFEKREIKSLNELGNDYDVVVNCAGLDAGKLAGDDDTIIPSRGIAVQVHAPWHKHFMYRDFSIFSIPKEDVVAIGTTRDMNSWRTEYDQSEVDGILERYCKLHPAMKGAPVIGAWCGLRPHRPAGIRLEKGEKKTEGGKKFAVVHHYGHGSNGFTLGYGTSQEAAQLIEEAIGSKV